jgi:uncharacterized protein
MNALLAIVKDVPVWYGNQMIPDYPKLKPISFDDLSQIEKCCTDKPISICELNATNLLIYKDYDHPQLTRINNNLCIHITSPNEPPFFLEPLGNHKLEETLNTCLDNTGQLSRVSEAFALSLPKDRYKITPIRDQFDYVYTTKSLAELKGRDYDGKRNHIKKFKSHFPNYKFVPLKSSDKTEALKLFEEWFDLKKKIRYFPKFSYDSQKTAVKLAFAHFNELKLIGGALCIGREMKGFILGSHLNSKMISVHFMYGHPAIQGSSQILLWEGCNRSFSAAKYVNLEQDLGIAGLRKAKLSNCPIRLEKKFEVRFIQQ